METYSPSNGRETAQTSMLPPPSPAFCRTHLSQHSFERRRRREEVVDTTIKTMSTRNLSITLLLFSLYSIASPTAAYTAGRNLAVIPTQPACWGTIAECIAGDEFGLPAESARRILSTSDYISYDALKRDSVPCSRRGASYYNCRAGAEANPYSRGCSAITQCRS